MVAEGGAAMRLDRFLWYVRIARTRSAAQAIAASGHLRLDGRPIDRAAAPVRIGSILTFATPRGQVRAVRSSEEHTSELQSLMRNSYAVFCLKKKTNE